MPDENEDALDIEEEEDEDEAEAEVDEETGHDDASLDELIDEELDEDEKLAFGDDEEEV